MGGYYERKFLLPLLPRTTSSVSIVTWLSSLFNVQSIFSMHYELDRNTGAAIENAVPLSTSVPDVSTECLLEIPSASGEVLLKKLFLAIFGRELPLPSILINSVLVKNTVAKIAVVRDRKSPEPLAPNKLPEAPLPNPAPMSVALLCCSKTSPITPSADSICTTIIKVFRNKKCIT